MRADYTDRLERWLFDACLPFWSAEGWDRAHGGFVEEMTLDGVDAALPYKRMRVAARQIYVFSHAAMLGARDGAPLIAKGAEWLVDRCWIREKGAFAHRLTRDGAVADDTIDLYDHAFAVYGFAWAFAATEDSSYREWAARSLDAIERHLSAPGRGFLSNPRDADTRDQNPHMHLLEAALAALDATGDARYADLARRLVELACDAIIRSDSGIVLEHFDAHWGPVEGDRGARIEPGHQFEWAWLLLQASNALGRDLDDPIRALVRRAEEGGVNRATGLVYNAVDVGGAVVNSRSRSWTNAERLKAGLALLEIGAPEGAATADAAARALLDKHIAADAERRVASGCWIEEFDAGGRPVSQTAPASIVYHLMLAATEAIRWRAGGG